MVSGEGAGRVPTTIEGFNAVQTKKFELELSGTGQGPTLLLLPGSYATPAAWRGVKGSLNGDFRFFSTSLPGYGTTPEVRTEDDPDIDAMIEFIGEVVDAVSMPVHVVGHSWGAQLALAAVLRGRISPLSLICFEANPIFALPIDGSFSWRSEVDSMVDDFGAALAAGDPEAAAIIIDFYSQPGTFQAMPDAVRAFCQATARTNLRDWRSAAAFAPSFEEFSDLDLPVTFVRGSATPTPIVDVTDQLSSHVPGARKEVVEGADHFLISTHPAACARLLETHIAEVGV